MRKTLISIGISIVIIVAAIGIVKLMNSKHKKESKQPERKAPLVEIINPKFGDFSFMAHATGKLKAVERFDIVAEVNGQLSKQALFFKEGKSYRKGELMLAINSTEYEMGLIAKKSDFITRITGVLADLKYDYPYAYQKWYDYVNSINVNKPLPTIPKFKTDKEKFYLVSKGLYSQYYNLKSMEERLSKYKIKAPYNGVLINAHAVGGEAVRPGSKLGTFINTSAFDLEVTYPLDVMRYIKVGTPAVLRSSDLDKSWKGKVVRIGASIDAKTQSVKVFIRTSGKDLIEGMFLTASVEQEPIKNAISISRKLINSEGKVFVVEDNKLKLKKVEVLESQDDMAIVKGLSRTDNIMTTVIKSAYNGMVVRTRLAMSNE